MILTHCNNFTIRTLVIENVEYGIQFAQSSHNIVLNCIIKNASSEGSPLYRPTGIDLLSSHNNEISNTEIKKFFIGIDYDLSGHNKVANSTIIDGVVGIQIMQSLSNVIYRNIIKNFSHYGIAQYLGSNTIIDGNIISNNRYGIYSDEAVESTISNNHISSNNEYGIDINRGVSNKVLKNNFIDNKIDAYLYYSKGIWFRNYWDRPRLLPKRINGTTEFFLFWYLLYENIPYIPIPRPPKIGIPRLYDIDWFPAKIPYNIQNNYDV